MIRRRVNPARPLLGNRQMKETNMHRAFVAGSILLAVMPAPALADQFQSTTVLDNAVQQFTGHAIGDEGGARTPVDSRLKLAACPMPQFEWLSAAQDAVVVRCMAPEWKIYVSVNRARPLAVPTPVPAPAPVADKVDPVIRRGDAIVIQAGGPGFSISRDGVALADAVPGARVLVKVEDKKPPIQAIAVSPGLATLPGWAQ